MRNELISHLLYEMAAAAAELRKRLHSVDYKMETVETVLHAHIERRCDRTLLNVAAHKHISIVPMISQHMDEFGIAVKREDDRLVASENAVIVRVAETVRMLARRLKLHQVDYVHDANFDLW